MLRAFARSIHYMLRVSWYEARAPYPELRVSCPARPAPRFHFGTTHFGTTVPLWNHRMITESAYIIDRGQNLCNSGWHGCCSWDFCRRHCPSWGRKLCPMKLAYATVVADGRVTLRGITGQSFTASKLSFDGRFVVRRNRY